MESSIRMLIAHLTRHRLTLDMNTTEHTECQAFSPVVRIGSSPPHQQASVPPPLGSRGGGHTRLRERGWGEPIRTKGQTLWYSRYNITPLRCTQYKCSCPDNGFSPVTYKTVLQYIFSHPFTQLVLCESHPTKTEIYSDREYRIHSCGRSSQCYFIHGEPQLNRILTLNTIVNESLGLRCIYVN
jgi:hypothetical protein